MKFDALKQDMIAAMKAHDKARKDAISNLVSAVKKVAIDEGCREEIPDELFDRVVLKELKGIQEQIDTCPDSRTDLKEQYRFNYEVTSAYAPKLMSEEEIRKLLLEKYADVIATKNKGAVMKAVMGELKGKADGKVINQAVAELCQ